MERDVEAAYDDLDAIRSRLFHYRDHGRVERAIDSIRAAMDELEWVMEGNDSEVI